MDKELKLYLDKCRSGDHYWVELINFPYIEIGYNKIVKWCYICGSIVEENDLDSKLLTPKDLVTIKKPRIFQEYTKRGKKMEQFKLAMKLVGFTFAAVWTLWFLYVGIISYDWFQEMVVHYGELDPGWFVDTLMTGYVLTIVVIATRIVLYGANFVGRWDLFKKSEDKEETE